ncbi:MAG: hypothetical protein HFE78_00550 [Clostridiales bacterium]|nr:hypothetical protein [Clostridiales bacterium]
MMMNEQNEVKLNGETVSPDLKTPESAKPPKKNKADAGPENVIVGIVGAFLFSLVGGVLYFAIYQTGFIAGISGLIIAALSIFGYQLFSGRKNSMVGAIVSIFMVLIVIFIAEYFCLSYEIYQQFHDDYGITLTEAIRSTNVFLEEKEILGAVLQDLLVAYALGFVAAASAIRNAFKAGSRKKQQAEAVPAGEAAAAPEKPEESAAPEEASPETIETK